LDHGDGISHCRVCLVSCFQFSFTKLHTFLPEAFPFSDGLEHLAGIPLLLPSIMYEGVHASHHRPTTYGNPLGPEYHPRQWAAILDLGDYPGKRDYPLLLAGSILGLAPIGFIIPSYHRHIERIGSAYVIQSTYRRTMNPEERRRSISR